MNIINLGNTIVNNYIVEIDNKYILIDTGYPEGFKCFQKKLNKLKIQLADIDYIFLTHAHDDHAGFLNELIKQTKAPVIIDENARERLLLGHNKWEGGCSGLIAKIFVVLMGFLGKSKHEYPKVDVSNRFILFDGQNQPLQDENIHLHIIKLPGHTKDSIGLYNEDVLFCGDAAMNGFPSINNQIIWIEDINDYKNSWDTMINLGIQQIYPSHGKSFCVTKLLKNKRKLDKIVLRKICEPNYS